MPNHRIDIAAIEAWTETNRLARIAYHTELDHCGMCGRVIRQDAGYCQPCQTTHHL